MKHFFCVCTCLLPVWIALAAPAPESPLKDWGEPVNPDKDCKIRRNGSVISMEMPGNDHDYDPVRKRFNAPRFLREIDGDFDLRVRVQIDCRHSDRSTVKGQPSFVSAGFLLLYPETDRAVCGRLEYGLAQKGIGLDAFANKPRLHWPQVEEESRKGIGEDGCAIVRGWQSNGKRNLVEPWDRKRLGQYYQISDRGWNGWPLLKKSGPVYLRLEVRDLSFFFFIGPDGDKWALAEQGGMGAYNAEQGRIIAYEKIQVGLAAYTSATEPCKVRFDQIKLIRGKKKAE